MQTIVFDGTVKGNLANFFYPTWNCQAKCIDGLREGRGVEVPDPTSPSKEFGGI